MRRPYPSDSGCNPLGRGPRNERAFTDALRIVAHRDDGGKVKLMRLAETLFDCAIKDKQGWAFSQIADRLDGKAIQQVDVSVQDNREINEFSDAELTAMLKERVIHAKIDDKPRADGEALN
jgi:hypothetical protein